MSARQNILTRLRAAAPAQRPLPDVAAYYAQATLAEAAAERLQRFIRNIEAAHAEVHVVGDDWPEALAALCQSKQVRRLLLSRATPHGLRFASTPQAGGIDCRDYAEPIEGWKDALFHDIDAGFSAARGAIASTGTLILWPDAAEPRLLSLVPPIHFVLLDAAQIHADLYGAINAEGWARGLPTNALLISGPSKTADIQQTLAYGAHGPKELVVLIRERGAA